MIMMAVTLIDGYVHKDPEAYFVLNEWGVTWRQTTNDTRIWPWHRVKEIQMWKTAERTS